MPPQRALAQFTCFFPPRMIICKEMDNSAKKSRNMLFTIAALAWPTMLEQLMQTAVQYVDTAMVSVLGDDATAAVGSTSTVNWLLGSTISAIGVGFLAYISQAFGRGEEEKARRASAQSILAVLVSGIIFTALATGLSGVVPVWMQVDQNIRAQASAYFLILYSTTLFRAANIIFGTVLRAAGDTKLPMIAGVAMNLVNVALNYFLIYPTRTVAAFGGEITLHGAGMGINGAATASAVSYALGGILLTVCLWRHKTISFKGYGIKPDFSILKPCLKVAFPNMIQRFLISFGYVAFASMINSLGKIYSAAHTVANTVESAFYIPGWGLQTAAATIAGNAWGAKDGKKLKDLVKTTSLVECTLMIISGAALFFAATPLMGLFSNDAEVIKQGGTVLKMVALSEPFYGVAIVLEGVMQGVGNTKTPFWFNVAGMWGIRILGTFVFLRAFPQLSGYGLVAAWGFMICHNVFLFISFALLYVTGKWKPKERTA